LTPARRFPAAYNLTRDAMNAIDSIGIIVVIILILWLLLRE
jgi:hypothetical protein